MQTQNSLARKVGLTALAAITLSACNSGIATDPVTAGCADPIKGSRYSMCGKLSTTGLNAPGPKSGMLGSLDSTHNATGNRYQLQGGSFHAYR